MTAAVGVIHGRFQPLHRGHMEYLLAGKQRCDVLIVGITNPDPWQVAEEPSDPARGASEANPFTYYERLLMVEAGLTTAGVSRDQLRIVPFPHSFPERLRFYAPQDAVYFLSIYGQWGEEKLARFEKLGLRTHVLWRRDKTLTSGTEIRRLMHSGGPWQDLVPRGVREVLTSLDAPARIRASAIAHVSPRESPCASSAGEE